ncbi:MAG: DUF1587 domain-containing protein [Bryobacteraceae bacterium]|nr:DUF1587 domain-containing protein [Bryobacteraceae bacterium]
MHYLAAVSLRLPTRLLCLTISLVSFAASEPRQVIDRYCLGCHTDGVKSGGLSLSKATAKTAAENPEAWEKVVRKLSHRHMPPIGAPRPDEATYNSTIGSLVSSLDSLPPNPGRTATFRRLTRLEYRNAVRDLLGVDADVSALLPADETSPGLDNVTVSNLSPTLLERYLGAARSISRLATGSPISSPDGHTVVLPPDLTQEDRLDGLAFGTRGGAVVPFQFPVDATWEIQFRLSRDRNERVEGLDAPATAEPPPRGKSHENVESPGEDAGTEAEVLAAVNAVDANGETAMHGACYKHLPAVAQYLGTHGAKVEVWNQKNKLGWTSLRIAAGVHRTGNLRASAETEAVVRQLMKSAGVEIVLEPEVVVSSYAKKE